MSRNPAPIVFFNAPMPYEVRAALKQIAAIEETSMAGIVQQALEAKVAQYQGRLLPPTSAGTDPRNV
jgi:hypothetical protein